jgi:hypothetical protein
MTPETLLLSYGITLPSYAPGRYYSTCPECSRLRSAANRNANPHYARQVGECGLDG